MVKQDPKYLPPWCLCIPQQPLEPGRSLKSASTSPNLCTCLFILLAWDALPHFSLSLLYCIGPQFVLFLSVGKLLLCFGFPRLTSPLPIWASLHTIATVGVVYRQQHHRVGGGGCQKCRVSGPALVLLARKPHFNRIAADARARGHQRLRSCRCFPRCSQLSPHRIFPTS